MRNTLLRLLLPTLATAGDYVTAVGASSDHPFALLCTTTNLKTADVLVRVNLTALAVDTSADLPADFNAKGWKQAVCMNSPIAFGKDDRVAYVSVGKLYDAEDWGYGSVVRVRVAGAGAGASLTVTGRQFLPAMPDENATGTANPSHLATADEGRTLFIASAGAGGFGRYSRPYVHRVADDAFGTTNATARLDLSSHVACSSGSTMRFSGLATAPSGSLLVAALYCGGAGTAVLTIDVHSFAVATSAKLDGAAMLGSFPRMLLVEQPPSPSPDAAARAPLLTYLVRPFGCAPRGPVRSICFDLVELRLGQARIALTNRSTPLWQQSQFWAGAGVGLMNQPCMPAALLPRSRGDAEGQRGGGDGPLTAIVSGVKLPGVPGGGIVPGLPPVGIRLGAVSIGGDARHPPRLASVKALENDTVAKLRGPPYQVFASPHLPSRLFAIGSEAGPTLMPERIIALDRDTLTALHALDLPVAPMPPR